MSSDVDYYGTCAECCNHPFVPRSPGSLFQAFFNKACPDLIFFLQEIVCGTIMLHRQIAQTVLQPKNVVVAAQVFYMLTYSVLYLSIQMYMTFSNLSVLIIVVHLK